jgi:hypothetical protein
MGRGHFLTIGWGNCDGIRSPDGLVVGLAPATLEFWVRFPNERNQGKQAHPVLKYRVPQGSHTLLLPPREQFCNRSCSNKTHTLLTTQDREIGVTFYWGSSLRRAQERLRPAPTQLAMLPLPSSSRRRQPADASSRAFSRPLLMPSKYPLPTPCLRQAGTHCHITSVPEICWCAMMC